MEQARKEKAIDALNMAAGFKKVAEDWFATGVGGWSESYAKQVRSALEKDVYPVLGKRSIVDITARDVLALLQKKERTAPEQARKLRRRIGEIFKFAVITELVTRNPVADLDTALKARRLVTTRGYRLVKFRPSTKPLRGPGASRFRRQYVCLY